ncbi:MAG: energy transducer TonB [Candidatus Acidiferrales bacterium]
MKFRHRFPFLAIALLATCSFPAAQSRSDAQSQKQETANNQTSQLKVIKSPTVPYPDESLTKNIEGKVVLRLVVEADGHVSHAEALSGPSELFQAAIDSAMQWQFESPANAPVTTTAEISYGHPRECPGPISDMGDVFASGRIWSNKGTFVDEDSDLDQPLPRYPEKDWRAGIAGEMILSLSLNTQGKVKKIRVVQSVSPDLDKAAARTVRAWRYKPRDGYPNPLPGVFQLHIFYMTMCNTEQ